MNEKKVMVVAAHPDDADFYCGGTIAKWIEQGARVKYLICTDGALGSEEEEKNPLELVELRKKEQETANEKLEVEETIWLNYPDMSLPAGEELREKIAMEYRRFCPEIVFSFDPWLRYELHPDHTIAGREAIYARLAAKMPMKYAQNEHGGLKAWSVSEMYLFKTDAPDMWVDTEDQLEKKLAALECHFSQFGAFVQDRESGMALLKEMSHRHPETGRVSEGFKHLVLEGVEGLKTYIGL